MATSNITVTTAPPVNFAVQTNRTNVSVTPTTGSTVTVSNGLTMPNDAIVVSKTNPNLQQQGLWVQTFDNGDFTMWIEDGI